MKDDGDPTLFVAWAFTILILVTLVTLVVFQP